MSEALMGHNYAKSVIDVACWDIFGKAVGRPVVDLLGGRVHDSLPMYKAVPLGPRLRWSTSCCINASRASIGFN